MPLRGITVETYDALAVWSAVSGRTRCKARAISFGEMTPSREEPERTGMCRLPETAIRARASSSVSEGERKTRSFECVMIWPTGTFQLVGSSDGSLPHVPWLTMQRSRSRCVRKPTMRSEPSFTTKLPTREWIIILIASASVDLLLIYLTTCEEYLSKSMIVFSCCSGCRCPLLLLLLLLPASRLAERPRPTLSPALANLRPTLATIECRGRNPRVDGTARSSPT
mmetsp:Transcript_37407/g.74785  ORF Transcript_37407/g.74785 Transcript_37407/m.74785 type:complete len:225 (+) Transcript_37407:1812-2486(+)